MTNDVPIHDFRLYFNHTAFVVLEIAMDPNSKTRAGSPQSFINVVYDFDSNPSLPDQSININMYTVELQLSEHLS